MIALIAKYIYLGGLIFVLAIIFTKFIAKLVEKLEKKEEGRDE